MMEILARRAIQDQDSALGILDRQGNRAQALRGMVSPDLLDVTLGIEVDKVVSDLIGLREAIWLPLWGPRMEATWRYAAKTLAFINQDLAAEGSADEQYPLLDIPALLQFRSCLRRYRRGSRCPLRHNLYSTGSFLQILPRDGHRCFAWRFLSTRPAEDFRL